LRPDVRVTIPTGSSGALPRDFVAPSTRRLIMKIRVAAAAVVVVMMMMMTDDLLANHHHYYANLSRWWLYEGQLLLLLWTMTDNNAKEYPRYRWCRYGVHRDISHQAISSCLLWHTPDRRNARATYRGENASTPRRRLAPTPTTAVPPIFPECTFGTPTTKCRVASR